MNPCLSIIVVTHNGRNYLAQLLASLCSQARNGFSIETLVVDNASRDGTAAWLAREFPEVRLLTNARNEGFAGPCNRAASEARSEWLAFVNNDMTLEPGWLAAMYTRARSGAASAYAGKILNADGRRVHFAGGGLNFYGAGFHTDFDQPVERCPAGPDELLYACGASMLVRRDVFLDAEGFDPDYFAYYEDVDFSWRLRLFGHRILYAPEAVSRHVHQGTSGRFSSVKTFYHCERNVLFTLVKNLSDENLYRILCAALLFANRRGVISYPLWVPDFSFPDEAPPARSRPVRTPRALFRKAKRFLAKPLLMSFLTPYGEALSRSWAIDAVLSQAETLWKKRRRVQARRLVSDEEIFRLFRDPLFTPCEDPTYTKLQKLLFNVWEIDKLFLPG